jgi:peptidoglycan/LPS O-acetylase OafA/YrhL
MPRNRGEELVTAQSLDVAASTAAVVGDRAKAGRNQALDGLRGVAVLLTFLVHFCGSYLAKFCGGNPNDVPFAGWNDTFGAVLYVLFRSHHGVLLFFVLSGYLIARLSTATDFSFGPYALRRSVRIFPASILALLTCVALGVVTLGWPMPSPGTVMANVIFLNGAPGLAVTPLVFNNVTWSLFYEMVFYLTLPVVVVVARRFAFPFLPSFVVCGLAVSFLPLAVGWDMRSFLCLYAGAIAGTLNERESARIRQIVPDYAVLLLYGVVAFAYSTDMISAAMLPVAFAPVGFLVIVSALGGGAMTRTLRTGALARLGRISYSFYLFHSVGIALAMGLHLRFTPPGLPPVLHLLLLGTLAMFAATAISVVSYALTESFYFRLFAKPVKTPNAAG